MYNIRKKIIICAIIISLVFSLASCNNSGTDNTTWFAGQGEYDAYIFRQKEELVELEPKDRGAALQIPENILGDISTAGLAETCINYPMFADMIFYDTLEIGFDRIKRQFNGLRELYLRTDVADVLVSIFISVDLDNLDRLDEYPTLKWQYICIMLYQESVISSLTEEQKKVLLKTISKQKKLINSKYDDHYGLYNLEILEQKINENYRNAELSRKVDGV